MSRLRLKGTSIFTDTIAAISTPLGQAGIGIVRLSGRDALSIADKVFFCREKLKPSQFKTYTIHYGWVVDKGHQSPVAGHRSPGIVDEAILTVMRAPRSYTREDVVEINCHSGIVPLRKTLELVLKNGARLAEPGEFTRRAFMNGRIDLVQAEAVLDIIQAKTEESLKLGLNQLQGRFSRKINAMRSQLLDILAHLEASIDFPEEDIKTAARRKLQRGLDKITAEIRAILDSAFKGKILREGITVVICGKPNVGKSSLLNALLREERAIVTRLPGTTKDTIEEVVNIHGLPMKVVDTAGISHPRDLIEKEAVRRSRLSIKKADLILFVLDGSTKISSEDEKVFAEIKDKKVMTVINKIDLKDRLNSVKLRQLVGRTKVERVSALKDRGIKGLERAICSMVWKGKLPAAEEALISNLRHIELLKEVQEAVKGTQQAFKVGWSAEFIAQELKVALEDLDRITGKSLSDDLLERIFSQFCIGK